MTRILHLQACLNSLSNKCVICLIDNAGNGPHALTTCPKGIANASDMDWVDFRCNLDFQKSTCFSCGLSTKVSVEILSMFLLLMRLASEILPGTRQKHPGKVPRAIYREKLCLERCGPTHAVHDLQPTRVSSARCKSASAGSICLRHR